MPPSAEPPAGSFGSPLVERLNEAPAHCDLTILTAYPPSWGHAGGGHFIDRNLLGRIQREHRHLAVTNRLSTATQADPEYPALSGVPLQIRASAITLSRAAMRVALRSEPYGVAKFRLFKQWRSAADALVAARPGRLVCTSFVPLLLAYDAGVKVESYLAFNTEWELSRQYAPRLLGRDFERHRDLELQMMSTVEHLYAVSHTDARVLASALDRDVVPLDWSYLSAAPRTTHSIATDAGHHQLRLGILGSYSWPPNKADVDTLINTIAPALRRRGVPIEIVVAGAGTEVLTRRPHVRAMGRVEEVRAFYDAIDIVVVPRTESTGISVKVIEARLHGKTVLTTRSVADALGYNSEFLIADSNAQIIDALAAYGGY